MQVYQKSLWKETFTSFSKFGEIIKGECFDRNLNVLIVGCSDGKYVFPFLEQGHQVTAIDNDPVSLYGGEMKFKTDIIKIDGLVKNLILEGYAESACTVIQCDLMDFEYTNQYDVVLTSCSWHYSKNFKYPIKQIINKIKNFVCRDGLFFADYMMPIKEKHFVLEHYIPPNKLRNFFGQQWKIILDLDLGVIEEEPHIGKEEWHTHHYGAFASKKIF
ncbi:methyltransferase domain-containing protein [Coleofasciculus sp. H7-2]|uniref:methyltransferase domain-containing protein n=1 Tax=Coleofasciculus sp. H7-2 TaxID=3351545 RepID=UPI00366FE2BE